jgi:hypothetical protein
MRQLLLALSAFCVLAATLVAAALVANQVKISENGEFRLIESNGIPDHKPGQFPNPGNPNTISPQQYKYRVPLDPRARDKPAPLGMHPFGVAINGVPFDPLAAEFWNNNRKSGWQYEALSGKINLGMDDSNAHVQPSGAYHYHGLPNGLIKKHKGAKHEMVLVGYAADGFPIYGRAGYSDPKDSHSKVKLLKSSYRLKPGARPDGPGGTYDGTFVQDWEYVAGAGDLDECNGREGVTPEYPEGTYYYVLTDAFPFIPRQFRGTPDESFLRHGPPGGGPPGGRGPRGGGQGGRPPPGQRPPRGKRPGPIPIQEL